MNRVMVRALFQDAFNQVMDNKVFRLLVLAVIVLIAPWYLISIKEDGIHLLYGWKTIGFADLFSAFGATAPKGKDLQVVFIQEMQNLFVQFLAGSLGILFCIAATAFFVPRMLEKGAADTFFTKPIHRFVLLASRYVAGLIFVAVLAFILVLGIHVGLLLFSGYSDPGFLWSALTLVYVYALVQTVSIVVGVFTRSSVAAILCTILFFTFNGCIQSLWVGVEYGRQRDLLGRKDSESVRRAISEEPFLVFLGQLLDGLHYTLPKTNDADVLTRKLRTVIVHARPVVQDEAVQLFVEEDPDGFTLETPGGPVDLTKTPAVWTARSGDGGKSTITLSRRSRLVEGMESRTSRQSTSQAATAFLKTLGKPPEIVEGPERESPDWTSLLCEIVRWKESSLSGTRLRQHAFFAVDDWMLELDANQMESAESGPRRMSKVWHFMEGIKVQKPEAAYMGKKEWYEAKFGWTAPLRFNAFFSLCSSIAFAALMLAIAAWRLSRVDF